MSSKFNYRFYSFTNMYVSSIQKGIQTAHVVSDMSVSLMTPDQKSAYDTWALNDKTVIVLNGGNQAMLDVIYSLAIPFGKKHGLPVVKFHEDEQSLNGALTAVGIILPETAYENAKSLREGGLVSLDYFDETDISFYKALNSCGLAN